MHRVHWAVVNVSCISSHLREVLGTHAAIEKCSGEGQEADITLHTGPWVRLSTLESRQSGIEQVKIDGILNGSQ